MDWLGSIMTAFSNFVWGMPMIVLLVGGGIFFTIYSRLTPFRYIGHGISLLTGKHDKDSEKGQLTHAQALSAALAGTVGMGNISGVALAITAGGPGAVFWMWLTALLGISTKFFTCSLGVMFRKTDKDGEVHGGPMYVITEGLGNKWKPLAVLFAFAGLWGTIPSFQANQLTAALREELIPKSWFSSPDMFNLVVAIVITLLVAGVIMGGLKRVAYVTTRLVPSMAIMYVLMTLAVLFNHLSEIPQLFQSIFVEAFQPKAISGGVLGVIIIGVSRGVFSNEAGIGTEVLAHSAVKTNESIREGLVGMLGPIVDTLIMCTCTALVILASGMWQDVEGVKGVELTMQVFGQELGVIGQVLLAIQILFLAASTMFTYWYYGEKCFVYLLGEANRKYYKPFYLTTIMIGCLVTLDIIFNFMIGMYGLMAIPTMLSAILLAPKVKAAAKVYFAKIS
jgi:AGCS family alanine or glycine:cation symporter